MNLNFTILTLIVLAQALTAQPLNRGIITTSNTAYDERNPVVSPDGKTLFITIANHPQNMGGRKDPGDIWYCLLDQNNQWTAPVHAGSVINDRSYNTIAGFSADGSEMVLMSHYTAEGSAARSQGIAVSKKNGNGWARPENIKIPYFQNKSNLISGYISPDFSVLVYSAETYGTYGVEDLFVCHRKADGEWGEPKNLGARINTQLQELCPSLSQDGKTLYFSTNGRKGLGSFDVFKATRLDDTWTNWTEPENYQQVNSDGRDWFFRDYPLFGYALYTRINNSDLYGDIQMFTPGTPPPADTTTVAHVPLSQPTTAIKESAPQGPDSHTVMLHGKVVNAKTGETIPATISFHSQSQFVKAPEKITALPSGYSIDVPSSAQYVISVEAKGFISTREKLDVQTYQMQDLEMNFKLQPIEVGTTVELKDVLFEQSKTALLPTSFDELDLVVSFLKANPNVRIELAGHTDNRGIPSQNLKLSQGRVDKVKDYLISKGVESKRIYGKGYGGTKPIASNESEETRKLNRRVEFTIKRN